MPKLNNGFMFSVHKIIIYQLVCLRPLAPTPSKASIANKSLKMQNATN